MKYTAPSKDLFIRNRKKFAQQMAPGHIAIFFSNEMLADNGDSHYAFSQDRDMYYLSGLDQEECILLMWPDAVKDEWKEILFIRETNEKIQVWEGWKYSKPEAREASGVENVQFFGKFDSTLRMMLTYAEGIYLDFNEHERQSLRNKAAAHAFVSEFSGLFPAHSLKRAYPILRDLRAVKEPDEILQVRIACSITEKAFRRVLGFVKPGVWEYEVQAEVIHEFLRNRANREAYGSIIASGKNACVLHYVQNNAQCSDGDVILMDFGAEYGLYASDLTRSIPVNGRFSPRQKEIYNAVLRVFKEARKLIVPGNTLEQFNKDAGLLMEAELLSLGLISKKEIEEQDPDWPAYKKYYMHGTSHFLGLDTHDVGHRYKAFQPGMIFTCEPGLYIPAENLGIRIENDILVTADGNEDLMATIPIEAEEIEDLMNS